MEKSMISVIIPVYNAAPWLKRCLDSVLGQSYDGPLEVILVDDGSTDGSGALCDAFTHSHPGIRVFHTENQGASLSRRLGLEQARGDYVTFVDSDDFVSPGYLSALRDLEETFHAGISACRVLPVQPGETLPEKEAEATALLLEGDPLMRRFFKYEFWGLYGKLYRKALLMNLSFPRATICEDYYVTAQLLHAKGRMAYLAAPLYFYEAHPGSLSRQAVSPRAFEEFENVSGVYAFTAREMPPYKDFAFSNAVETAVKLLLASRRQSRRFRTERMGLKTFLSSHRRDLVSCRPLHWKVAVLALLLSLT